MAKPFCILAEFPDVDSLRHAVCKARAEGYTRLDAYSPFPIPGLAEDLGFDEDRVPWLTFFGGLLGGGIMLFIMWFTNAVDYPINVGGRPMAAWSAFLFPSFEVGTLWAVMAAALGMMLMNRLPDRRHPLIRFDAFHLATDSKFFLAVDSDDPHSPPDQTRRFLESLSPEGVWEVPP